MASETEIQQQIRLACSNGNARLWRNNSGKLPDPRTGRVVQFGVGSPGGSDLIGYRTVMPVCPACGHQHGEVAQFAAIEVKTATGRATAQQKQFLQHIKNAGGLSGIARSVEEAQKLLLS